MSSGRLEASEPGNTLTPLHTTSSQEKTKPQPTQFLALFALSVACSRHGRQSQCHRSIIGATWLLAALLPRMELGDAACKGSASSRGCVAHEGLNTAPQSDALLTASHIRAFARERPRSLLPVVWLLTSAPQAGASFV